MDILFGCLVYLASTWVFNRSFSAIDASVVVFFALAPDLDFVPFLLLRRRLKLVSHWFIHFPLLYIPIGAIWVWLASRGEWFFVVSFILASLAHFLHDSKAVQGVQWLWPISRAGWAIEGLGLVRVELEERKLVYDWLRQQASERNILDEIRLRVGKHRPKWLDR